MAAGALLVVLLAWPARASAQLAASPDPLDLGDVRVQAIASGAVTLSNTGALAVPVTGCSITPATTDFALSSCPSSVAAGGMASVGLRFSPQSTGPQTATLTITYDVALSLTVELDAKGTAPDMVVSVVPATTPPLDFGDSVVGSPSATTYTVRVANQGDADLNASLSESGANPGDWSYSPAATSFTVAPGGARDIVASFTAQSTGARAATVSITDDDGLSTASSASFDMIGTGRAPLLQVSPTTLAFGSQPVGSASPAQNLTISNGGDAPLTITSVSIPGQNAADYPVTGFPGSAVLMPGGQLVVQVVFQPQDAGGRNATLVVASDSPVSPTSVSVALTGSGTGSAGVALSPTALTFGSVDLQAATSVTRTLTVRNPGNLRLDVSSIAFTDLDGNPLADPPYTLSRSAPLSIAPGGQVDIDVVYTPVVESEGDYAVLVISTNVGNAPEVDVTLSGRGLDRHIAVSAERVDFPATYRNPASPASFDLQVSNTGEEPLLLSAVMLGGADAASFTLVSDVPAQIEPLGAVTLTIDFAPTRAGTDPIDAQLLFVNDDDQSPMVRVDLSGTGILPPVEASRDQIDYGSVNVGLQEPPPGDGALVLVNHSDTDAFVIQAVEVVDQDGQPLEGFRVRGFDDPVNIAPGQELPLDVEFAPGAAGRFTGRIAVLVGADPEPVVAIPVSGVAVGGSLRGSGCAAGGGAGGGGGGGGGGVALVLAMALVALPRRRWARSLRSLRRRPPPRRRARSLRS